jgi:hypothetical protein
MKDVTPKEETPQTLHLSFSCMTLSPQQTGGSSAVRPWRPVRTMLPPDVARSPSSAQATSAPASAEPSAHDRPSPGPEPATSARFPSKTNSNKGPTPSFRATD